MLDPSLHSAASAKIETEGKSFSGYAGALIRRDLEAGSSEKLTADERAALRADVTREVLKALGARKRA